MASSAFDLYSVTFYCHLLMPMRVLSAQWVCIFMWDAIARARACKVYHGYPRTCLSLMHSTLYARVVAGRIHKRKQTLFCGVGIPQADMMLKYCLSRCLCRRCCTQSAMIARASCLVLACVRISWRCQSMDGNRMCHDLRWKSLTAGTVVSKSNRRHASSRNSILGTCLKCDV